MNVNFSFEDKWHVDEVFTDAVPGGELLLWSKDQGVFSNFTAWTQGAGVPVPKKLK